ncbi:Armadillo-like helical [Artemisia annua]|uniref:Armadillo-like helical n=1 Tax=Artemisia annua TaxID=35608 RepID=A0A2U1M4B8_ARTAN|nr:Armadillo-like helical [Artemisia annua]
MTSHVITKIMNAVVKRLRDGECNGVREACVEAVRVVVREVVGEFVTVVGKLVEVVGGKSEGDVNSVIGGAMCLSAAVDEVSAGRAGRAGRGVTDSERVYLVKVLARVMKMLRSEGGCKGKGAGALLGVVGSVCGCGVVVGGSNGGLLGLVVTSLVEFLGSEDWAVRKGAVGALGKLASVEKGKGSLVEFKAGCVLALENKRFDKVKVVRESMNQTLELWREIPGSSDEVPASPKVNGNSSSKDNGTRKSPAIRPRIPSATAIETPPKETTSNSKHSPVQRLSPTTPQSRSPPKSNYRKQSGSIARKVDFDKETDQKIKVSIPKPVSFDGNCKEKVMRENMVDSDKNIMLETEKRVTEQVISNKTKDSTFGKLGGSKFGSRVVPFIDECELDTDINGRAIEHGYGNQKEVENISRIQNQLVQIENQQSNLLNLLQKFIGSSRSGMNSLETRVNGLEKALDEISYDLAISTGRVSNSDSCCMGTEFLSPKYWWRTEGSFYSPRSPFRGSQQALSDRFNPDSPTRGIAPNTPGGGFGSPGRSSDSLLSARKKKVTQGQNRYFDRFDGGSFSNCVQQRN